MLEQTLRTLFSTKDLSRVKDYVTRQWSKILSNRVSVQVWTRLCCCLHACIAATAAEILYIVFRPSGAKASCLISARIQLPADKSRALMLTACVQACTDCMHCTISSLTKFCSVVTHCTKYYLSAVTHYLNCRLPWLCTGLCILQGGAAGHLLPQCCHATSSCHCICQSHVS